MRKFLLTISVLSLLVGIPSFIFAKDGGLDDSVITGGNLSSSSSESENDSENDLEDSSEDSSDDSSSTDTVVAGTNAGLSSAVDSLIKKMEGVSDADFCSKISGAVATLSPEEKASLAWRSDSYSKNIKLDASKNASDDEAEEYNSLKDSYDEISSSISDDGDTTSSDKAAIRGSYLDLMSEYRDGGVNKVRDEKIRNFLDKSAECLKNGTSVKDAIAGVAASIGVPITITQNDVKEEDKGKELPVVTTVKSEDSLKSFITLAIAGDVNVKSVVTDGSRTEAVYKQKGKLFGLLPVKMNVHAVVNADGTASVKYPWYKFISSATGGKVTPETILENATLSKGEKLSKSDQANIVLGILKAFENTIAK